MGCREIGQIRPGRPRITQRTGQCPNRGQRRRSCFHQAARRLRGGGPWHFGTSNPARDGRASRQGDARCRRRRRRTDPYTRARERNASFSGAGLYDSAWPVLPKPISSALAFGGAAAPLIEAARDWLAEPCRERRVLPAYAGRLSPRPDTVFRLYCAPICGASPQLVTLHDIKPADLRSFLASRRGTGAGSRSLMRQLSGLRSFAKHLERQGLGNVAAFSALRSPKVARSLPKGPAGAGGAGRRRCRIACRRFAPGLDSGAGRRRAQPALRRRSAYLRGIVDQAPGCTPRRRRYADRHRQGPQDPQRAGDRARATGGRHLSRTLPLRAAGGRAAFHRRQRAALYRRG